MNSVDREDPILLAAAILVLLGSEHKNNFDQFSVFANSMKCYGYSKRVCYHIVKNIESSYDN